ncbi:hypothetical protein SUGI_0424510 [Cryptomeria japonica]|nr:hypothetical protein SUGI_0424510 [Cryptomeria japonica]
METDLFEAAKADDVEPFEQLPLHRLNEVSDARNSFVHIAAFHGSKRVMEKLLEYIRSSDLEGQNHELLRRQNRHGNTAFHEAARGGKAEVLQILITHSPQLARELASVRNRAGETAVFKAAFAGHTDIIDMFENFLRPMPMEMYSRGSDGQTSLHCAIFNKRTDVVKKLLFHKHELISTIDGLGRTPLHVAALIPPFKELVPPFHPWLTTTHIKENENIAELLLREDKSLCHKMDDGRHNPLHIAVKEANDKVMKTILRYGGDCIEQVDNEGRNALHLAVKNAELIYERIPERMEDMLESLVSATKMLINDCDNYGKTTLDIAIDSMHKDELLFSGVTVVETMWAMMHTKGKITNDSHMDGKES